jgi:uncharacterized membrane protein
VQIAWVAEAMLMLGLGIRFRLGAVKATCPFLLALAALAVFRRYVLTAPDAMNPMWNMRSGSALLLALGFGASAILLRVFRDRADAWESADATANLLSVLCHLTVFGAFTAETLIWFHNPDMRPAHAPVKMEQFLLSGGYALYAIALVAGGFLFRKRIPRLLGLMLFAVAAVKVCLFDVSHLDEWMRMGAFCVLGVLMLLGSFVYYANRDFLNRELLGIARPGEAEGGPATDASP